MPEESPFPRSETRARVLGTQARVRRLDRIESAVQNVVILVFFLGYLLDVGGLSLAAFVSWGVLNWVIGGQQSRAQLEADAARDADFAERLSGSGRRGLRVVEPSSTADVDHFTRESGGRVHVIAADFRDGSKDATVTRWLIDVGDRVEAGDPIAEVQYDSWTLEFTAPIAGKINDLRAKPSVPMALGSVLCVLNPT